MCRMSAVPRDRRFDITADDEAICIHPFPLADLLPASVEYLAKKECNREIARCKDKLPNPLCTSKHTLWGPFDRISVTFADCPALAALLSPDRRRSASSRYFAAYEVRRQRKVREHDARASARRVAAREAQTIAKRQAAAARAARRGGKKSPHIRVHPLSPSSSPSSASSASASPSPPPAPRAKPAKRKRSDSDSDSDDEQPTPQQRQQIVNAAARDTRAAQRSPDVAAAAAAITTLAHPPGHFGPSRNKLPAGQTYRYKNTALDRPRYQNPKRK
jgi:hypothetical protein